MKLIFCLVVSVMLWCGIAQAQPFAEVNIGLTSRLMFTGYANAGYMHLNHNYSGPMVAVTAGVEQGINAGAYAGWQWYGIAMYAGAAHFQAMNSKLAEGSRIYPIAGIQYRYPENRTVIDLRYMGDAIHLTLGVRIGRHHNQ